MSDLLNIGRSGLLAAQRQLGVTSNNIANANTAGYHRQVAEQRSIGSDFIGGAFQGAGTYVSDVKRIYNEFATKEMRISQSNLSYSEAKYTKLNELDQLFSLTGKSVPNAINDMFDAFNKLGDLPSDPGMRTNLLSNADRVAQSIRSLSSQLDVQYNNTNDQIRATADRINDISKEIADINTKLMGQQVQDPALQDRQEQLIQELSQYTDVNAVPLENGAKSIMIGGSVMLVSGEIPMQLGVTDGDPFGDEIGLTVTSGGRTVSVDGARLGGQMQALFEYRDQSLVPAKMQLSQLAAGIAGAINEAQRNGFDLNGQIGQDIFSDINSPELSLGRVGGYSENTGNAQLSVNIDDFSQLGSGSYTLSFEAGQYQLLNKTSGEQIPLTPDPNDPSRLIGGDGFSIRIDAGAMNDGDRFEIRPAAGISSALEVTMTDPDGIAAAGYSIEADENNSGATLGVLGVDRTANNFPTADSPLTLTFDASNGTYTATDKDGNTVSSGPYTPPSLTVAGVTLAVPNDLKDGDSFTLDMSFGEGDNSNALAMAGLQTDKIMNGGRQTFVDVFNQTINSVGAQTKRAAGEVESAQAFYNQAYTRVQSESGVNLDEEAANLMRFQQAYQASARLMSTASELYDTLFNSLR
ncbi:flagellar hook-associated protein FlgK [Paraferrimonas sedimenticola]|uniref:Flagellar hook-associated protein 1 n=1 Tax=Paraferrimonas sedimenticola TaxID=375674 RepID=A0AA37RTG1_9GAMM|nr:flagellar hook-associated protein FlgK [Paraferrimonas sedimenticola]GLP94986.1 flagellar hook-associated protein FlgK [Paraferrimonas sedimenticola]